MDPDGGARYDNQQLFHRHPLGFVRRVLNDFTAGALDAATAASHLGVSRSRLYELRTALLSERAGFAPKPIIASSWSSCRCKIRPTTTSSPMS